MLKNVGGRSKAVWTMLKKNRRFGSGGRPLIYLWNISKACMLMTALDNMTCTWIENMIFYQDWMHAIISKRFSSLNMFQCLHCIKVPNLFQLCASDTTSWQIYAFHWFHSNDCVFYEEEKTGHFLYLISCWKYDLVFLHILHFGKEICLDNSTRVPGTEDHIVGRPKESVMITIEILVKIWFHKNVIIIVEPIKHCFFPKTYLKPAAIALGISM